MKALILNYFEGRVQENKLSIYFYQHLLVLQLLCKKHVFLQEVIAKFLTSETVLKYFHQYLQLKNNLTISI